MCPKNGRLIVFEGVARSGKSTLIHLVSERLKERGFDVTLTEWNSYQPLQDLINHKKTYFTFTPITYSLLHLAEFSLRYEEIVKPALEAGQIVIADRWVYTAITRDVARGIPEEYVRQCYRFARKPDITFYVEVPAKEAYSRHLKTKKYFGYNCGVDIRPDLPVEEAFKKYHNDLHRHYRRISKEESFISLDGTKQPQILLESIWSHLQNILEITLV